MAEPKYKHGEITSQIINAAYEVHGILGQGFLEKVYQNALACELRSRGLACEIEKPIAVKYKEQVVGEYFADIFVENKVIVEIKAVENMNPAFEAQLLNYLKATEMKVGLLMNFASSVSVKRMVM